MVALKANMSFKTLSEVQIVHNSGTNQTSQFYDNYKDSQFYDNKDGNFYDNN